jgi:hypothetical protein
MSLQRIIRIVLIFAPLLLFALVLALPYCSARLSLLLNGFPFAHVVPKEKLDIFHYVQMDSFSYKAVVFSGGKAVGMIDQRTGAFACFEPFSQQPNSVDGGSPMLFNALLCIAWSSRWFLFPVQAILLLFIWLQQRKMRARFCGYDI